MKPSAPQIHPLGDSAVTLNFGIERNAELLSRIHTTAKLLAARKLAHVQDIVPGYRSIAIFYDPLLTSYDQIASDLLRECARPIESTTPLPDAREHRIPVRYDGADLRDVAAATGFSVEDVILRHAGRSYTVDLLGFVPGFAYLSELDPALNLPRRAQPRARVPAGSVAIADAQTAVYPLDTPGGWHLIGRTDAVMFDPVRAEPALLCPGDTVRFVRVT